MQPRGCNGYHVCLQSSCRLSLPQKMFESILQQFGLSKNESTIYECLLVEGESAVATICKKANIHRRNVYDALQRLIEKGYVLESFTKRENIYGAVPPEKFKEHLKEKEEILDRALPHMKSLYDQKPFSNEVYVFKGAEGWKNYLQDIVRVGEDFYCIGGKGGWLDKRTIDYFPNFIKGLQSQNIKMRHIFDVEVKTDCPEILEHVGKDYRFFPSQCSSHTSADIYGDRVAITSNLNAGHFTENDFTLTVIRNQQVADGFRTWFEFMYEICSKP